MTRIAVIHTTYSWPPMGGATVDIDEILTRLARDHEVKLFLPRYPRPFSRCRIEGDRPFPIEALPFTPLSWRPGPIVKAFRRAIDAFKPDAVMVGDGWHLKPSLFEAVADYRPWLRIYAYENLCIVNNGTFFADGEPCGNHLLRDPDRCRRCARRQPVTGFWYRQERLAARAFSAGYPRRVETMIRSARGIIVYNRMTADLLAPFNPRVETAPSGVDTRRMTAADAKPDGDPMILVPGRMSDPVKGLVTALNAAEMLAASGRRFTLVATAVTREELSRLWGDRNPPPYLQLAGWVDPGRMRRLYREAAIAVVPSLWPEPQGIVAVEALASGVPVAVSDTGGLPDLIEEGVTGYRFPPGDAEELAARLTPLLDDPRRREEMGRAARQAAERHFDWDVIYQRYYQDRFNDQD